MKAWIQMDTTVRDQSFTICSLLIHSTVTYTYWCFKQSDQLVRAWKQNDDHDDYVGL